MSSNTKMFNIDIVSEGTRLQGTFVCKRLSIMDRSRVNARMLQLNGGFHVTEDNPSMGPTDFMDNINSAIATLEVALVKAPAWWNLDNISDINVLAAVTKEVTAFENSFRPGWSPEVENGSVQSGQGERGAQSAASNNAGSATAVVGKEVSDSLEP